MTQGKGYTLREPTLPIEGFRFAVGQDRQGRWILRDRMGLVEGWFRDRISAIDYALDKGGRQPLQVYCLPEQHLRLAERLFPLTFQLKVVPKTA